MKYTYFDKYKYSSVNELSIGDEYDYYISTFNESDRVRLTFDAINAKRKIWLILPEYHDSLFANNGEKFNFSSYGDYDTIISMIDTLGINNTHKICMDITGFLTQHMYFILKYISSTNLSESIDIIYSEPQKYIDAEKTKFTDSFYDVEQLHGFGGVHSPDTTNDLLIIASGYDDSRITDVANKKKKARKIQLLGFPSLQPDMFQENIIQAYKAESAVGSECFKNIDLNLFAPASDPFVAAQTISDFLKREQRAKTFTNIYLTPISSKPHALGMALFYLWEKCWEKPISIIYPMCNKYIKNNSIGISKIWKYKFEFPSI